MESTETQRVSANSHTTKLRTIDYTMPESRIPSDLYQLVLEVQAIQKIAREQGIFVEDRELLKCPNCHLQEDVAISGQLSVYFATGEALDTGLRFEAISETAFRCPVCGSVVELEEDQ